MIILIGVMEYVVFVILFGFEFCILFDVIGFELKRQKQPSIWILFSLINSRANISYGHMEQKK